MSRRVYADGVMLFRGVEHVSGSEEYAFHVEHIALEPV